MLAIEFTHALKVAELADHHRDPFDRILIAQAMVGNMALVSGDEKFNMYSVPVIGKSRNTTLPKFIKVLPKEKGFQVN